MRNSYVSEKRLSNEAWKDQVALQAVINSTECSFIKALKVLETSNWHIDTAIELVYNSK